VSLPLAIHPHAKEELRAAMDWYEDRAEGLGEAFLDAVVHALERGVPLTSDESERLRKGCSFHRYLLRRFPYTLIVLEAPAAPLQVVAIAHHKRKPGYWLSRVGSSLRRPRPRRHR